MGSMPIKDDAVWVKHIEGDNALRERLIALPPGALIELEVDGVLGKWEKMKVGRDGRPTLGIKPVESMKEVWKQFRKRTGERVSVREVQSADAYLASLHSTLTEWDSEEDDLAYADL